MATATVNIQSDANLDYEAGAFRGTFAVLDDISFGLEGSTGPSQSEETTRLFEEYKATVRDQLAQALVHLNKPRRLLSDEESESVFQAGIGETLNFNKKIIFDWLDGQKTANVSITATVIDIGYPDANVTSSSGSVDAYDEWLDAPINVSP